MDLVTLLVATIGAANDSATASQPQSPEGVGILVEWTWRQITSLRLLEALVFSSFGTVCLFYGWRVFRVLVIMSFMLIGGATGVVVAKNVGAENGLLLSGMMAVTMGIVSVPLMHWAVSILGILTGGILAGGLWYACSFPENYLWAGGLIGAVAGGMIPFIVFKASVMLFTSLSGSTFILAGVLALLNIYPPTREQIQLYVYGHRWFLPVALIVFTAVGVYWQNRLLKGAASWTVSSNFK